jgi:hypothetical protein
MDPTDAKLPDGWPDNWAGCDVLGDGGPDAPPVPVVAPDPPAPVVIDDAYMERRMNALQLDGFGFADD